MTQQAELTTEEQRLHQSWVAHLPDIMKIFVWIAENPGIHPNNTRHAVVELLEKIQEHARD